MTQAPSTDPPLQAILLDIEGTVSPIDFVHREMFPFARRHLSEYLTRHHDSDALRRVCAHVIAEATDVDAESSCDLDDSTTVARILAAVHSLMDRDAKVTGLKQLQGMIWQQGFESGALQAPIFADVVPFLRRCREVGTPVSIYSSGSIDAQQLFFAHTDEGDLRSYLAGYYDTTIGAKTERASYAKLAERLQVSAGDILFASDVVRELDAAQQAGLRTLLCVRPGNPPVAAPHQHRSQSTLAGIV